MKAIFAITIAAALLATTTIVTIYAGQAAPSRILRQAPKANSDVPTPVLDAWVHWKQRYGKAFGSDSEESYRLSVFHKNFKYIQANQCDSCSYTIGLNKFADMSTEEFKKTYLGSQVPQTKKNFKSLTSKLDTGLPTQTPASVDWQSAGAVTPIKNQGQCGSCWSFSVSGAMEGLNQIKNGSLKSFSEQQQMDCSKDLGNLSCQGGYMDKAYDYLQSKGIMSEESYPYQAIDRYACAYDASKVEFNIDGHNDVPVDDNDELTAAIAQVPVSVAISGEQIQFYVNGIWSYWLCLTDTDHGVLAVGYDTDDSGKKFYKVKNSWGADWGEEGYIRFERKEGKGVGMCGITKQASYPTLNN
jgi:C1A family cysteine protease